ncbi:CdaR family protein [Gemelliphila palaticanis]|uniref:YbbR domain-containing protein n=1 Tax=Gemelliphila palaticanis TaxID=81950 RepID=A0ABX2T3E0_9BACL|nr:CdaR family protein [Gemella palaticanis]MBF0716069.1 hypothetical protein [Gemella palaticanis]NYS47999.1 hypothetical protein [Gemella palaticanis]
MNKDKLPLILTSFLISLLLFFSVNDIFSKYFSPNSKGATATTWLNDVPLEVTYDRDKYYVLGVPDTTDVKVSGEQSTVQKISLEKNLKARLDLSKVEVGDDQKIKIEIIGVDDKNTQAVSEPEFITVSVRDRVTKEFPVIPKVKNERLLLGYTIKSLSLNMPKVKISGAEETINSIYEVRAESDLKTKISKNTSEEVKFVAYDRNFNKIEDIDIEKVTTTMNIELESIEKTLEVSINKVDNLPSGFTLDSIIIEPSSIILRAENKDILDSIKEVFVDVELSSLKEETTELKSLKVYANTTEKYSIDSPTVNVTIKIKKDK